MAMIKFSGLIDDIRGQMGGTVFSVWKADRAYIRKAAAIIHNPRSTEQQKVRTFTSYLSGQWFSTLTGAQRILWDAYAASEAAGRHGGAQYSGGSGDIIPGNRGVMSGFNAFLMINLRQVMCDLIATFDPAAITLVPPVLDPSPMVEDLAIVYNVGTFDVTWTVPNGAVAGDMLRIWLRSYDTGAHRQMTSYLTVVTAAIGLTTTKFAKGGVIPFLNKPGMYDFQADVMSVEGVLSAPSRIFTVEAT